MAITKFKTQDGRTCEGLVMWLDFAGKRTKFVMPYGCGYRGWSLVHYPTGQYVSTVYDKWEVDRIIKECGLSPRPSKRAVMEGLLSRIIKKFGLKKVRSHLSVPVINF